MKNITKTNIFTLLAVLLLGSQAVSAQTLALTHVNIIDVKQQTVLMDKTILLKGNKIAAIQPASQDVLDKDVVLLDMAGRYVTPGLIDVHVHHATDPDAWDKDKITKQRLRNLLTGGVTSVRDMGGDARALAFLKRQAQLDVIHSPDIYFSAIIGGPDFFDDPRTIASAKGELPGQVNWMRSVTDDSELNRLLLQAKGTGATGIKIYAKVSAPLVARLAEEAKKVGLKVWGHAFIGPAKPGEVSDAGVETISHVPDLAAEFIDNFYDYRREGKSIPPSLMSKGLDKQNYSAVIDKIKANDTILDATLTVFDQHSSRSDFSRMLDKWGKAYIRYAHEVGVTIAAGTDAFSDDEVMLHKELRLLVNEVGMSPMQALQAATINGAKVIGIDESHGSIEVGKVANLVVFAKDPSTHIANLSSIKQVVKNGRFVYLRDNPDLPFSNIRQGAGLAWLSGQRANVAGHG